MQGIVLHCPNADCKKLLMKEVVLVPGSSLVCKCFYCGNRIRLKADYKRITMENLEKNSMDKNAFTIM